MVDKSFLVERERREILPQRLTDIMYCKTDNDAVKWKLCKNKSGSVLLFFPNKQPSNFFSSQIHEDPSLTNVMREEDKHVAPGSSDQSVALFTLTGDRKSLTRRDFQTER